MGSNEVKVGEGSALAGENEAPLHGTMNDFPGSSPQTSPLARGLDPVVASQPTTTTPAFGGNPTAHAKSLAPLQQLVALGHGKVGVKMGRGETNP